MSAPRGRALLQALEDRGIKITNGDLLEAFREYEGVCRMRAEQASRASRRRDLEVELENRRTAEATTTRSEHVLPMLRKIFSQQPADAALKCLMNSGRLRS
jgi:hypothetical protein